jgi:hypothetical protein
MQEVARTGNAYKKIQRFESLVGMRIVVMDRKRRRMRDEYIQLAALTDLAGKQAR